MKIACARMKIERMVQLMVDMLDALFFLTDQHPFLDDTTVQVILNDDVNTLTTMATTLENNLSEALLNEDFDCYQISNEQWILHMKTRETPRGFYFTPSEWCNAMLGLISIMISVVEDRPRCTGKDGIETCERVHDFHSDDAYIDFEREFMGMIEREKIFKQEPRRTWKGDES